jgi:hypothetical protein
MNAGRLAPDETTAITILPARARDFAGDCWRALEAEAGSAPLACSWPWTETWLRHYGDVVHHRFAIGEGDLAESGIALLTDEVRHRGPLRRCVVHIGTAGEPRGEGVYVERNGILAGPGQELSFVQALVQHLHAEGWDRLELDGFRPDHAAWVLAAEPRLGIRREPCPVFDLREASGGLDAVLDLLDPGPRRRVRRSLRGLGDLTCEWAATPSRALDVFDELVELNRARWRREGRPSAFDRERFRGFHRALVARVASASAVLFRVRAEERTIGCLYALIDGKDVLFYQGGFASFDDNRLRPGMVTHALLIAACAERGFRLYDMLAGEARYKRELSTTERQLVWAEARWRNGRPWATRPVATSDASDATV